MRDRHWKDIKDTLGITLIPDDITSLSRLLDRGIDTHIHALNIISTNASIEYNIEKSLLDMHAQWQSTTIDCEVYNGSQKDTISVTDKIPPKDKDIVYALNVDSASSIECLLEDHIMKTRGLLAFPSHTLIPFKDSIDDWMNQLVSTQNTLLGTRYMSLCIYLYMSIYLCLYIIYMLVVIPELRSC